MFHGARLPDDLEELNRLYLGTRLLAGTSMMQQRLAADRGREGSSQPDRQPAVSRGYFMWKNTAH